MLSLLFLSKNKNKPSNTTYLRDNRLRLCGKRTSVATTIKPR